MNVSLSNPLPLASISLPVDSQTGCTAEPSIPAAHHLPLAFLLVMAVVLPATGAQASWAVKPTREGGPEAAFSFCKPLASKAGLGSLHLS